MRRIVCVIPALLFAAGCGGDGQDSVLVLAASSLTEAFEELASVAESDHLDVEFSFAGSPTLLEQVEQGAPADVIAVADPALLGDTESFVFARNQVVVVAAQGSTITSVDGLATDGVRVVLANESVPIGAYARDALTELGLLDAVLANVVSDEPDARSVLAKVALGEADAGIVYATDARADGRVRVVGDPLPVETAYAAAVVEDAPHEAAAQRFVAFLASPAAHQVLERFGYRIP